jgi:ZIP family zinc transporter
MIIFIAISAIVCTVLGGLFAFKYQDKLHLVLGFSAGAIIGVSFFDLLPEAIELSEGVFDVSVVTSTVALGFVIYMLLDRFVMGHEHVDEHCENENHRGRLGAGSLSVHSFLDGMAIGLAFQVSTEVGLVVTLAVLAHKFFDGLNTVSLILKNGGSQKEAVKWLSVGAIAPVLGILSTKLFTLQESSLGLVLALFGGFFLYIGASDLLPESHHRHPTYWTTFATVLGMAILYAIIKVAH